MAIVLDGTANTVTPLNGALGATTPSTVVATTISGTDLTTTGNTILGNASTDTLNVGNGDLVKDASGNVGIGTASPGGKVTISGTPTSTSFGNRLTLNLLNTNTTGNQSCQIALGSAGSVVGSVFISSDNAADGTQTGVGTFGASDILRFVTTSAERARIDSSGNLLVGATSAILGGQLTIAQRSGSTSPITCELYYASTKAIKFGWYGGEIGSISVNAGGTAIAYNTSSDYRLKEDIVPMSGALAKVAALKPVSYKWKSDGSDSQGFIAHELQEVVPECVTGEKDAVDTEGKPQYQGIDTSFLVATLTAAIQELNAKFEEYKASHP
jgi:hypothetical protein